METKVEWEKGDGGKETLDARRTCPLNISECEEQGRM